MESRFKQSLLIISVACVAAFTYFFSFQTETPVLVHDPSYEYSLKMGNKKIRSYRSPASQKKLQEALRELEDKKLSSETEDSKKIKNKKPSKATGLLLGQDLSKAPTATPIANREGEFESLNQDRAQNKNQKKLNDPDAPPIIGAPLPYSGLTQEETTKDDTKDKGSPLPPKKKPTLIGRIIPLSGVVSFQENDFFISSAYAANTCTDPRILLFDLTDMSVLLDNPLTDAVINENISFVFDPLALKLIIETPSRYMLQTVGCLTNYQRIITSFYEPQDLDRATTLISKIVNSTLSDKLFVTIPDDIQQLYSEINKQATTVNTIEDVYAIISSNPALADKFEETFLGGEPIALTVAAPDLYGLTFHDRLKEKLSYTYDIIASHWDSSYQIGYEWRIDGTTVGTTKQWTYIPTANSPNAQVITLVVGRKNTLDDLVDTSVRYHQLDFDIVIEDTHPVTAPVIALASTSTDPTSTKNIGIEVSSGLLIDGFYSGCETFSSMAITEGSAIPVPGDFTYTCQNGPSDELSYTIQNPADGSVALNVWSMDVEGRISPVPSPLSIVVDTTFPVMNFIGINPNYRADQSYTFTWDLTEVHAKATQSFKLEFFNGSAWGPLPAVALTDGPHNGTNFSTSYHLPNLNIANAKLRLTYADTLGHETSIESSSFEVQGPILASTPNPLDMGSVQNRTTSSSFTLEFTNSGVVSSRTCSAVTLAGSNAAEFSIVSDGCSGTTISPAGSCPVIITATPDQEGVRGASATINCGNDSFTTAITIVSLNNAPVIASTNQTTPEDTAVIVDFGPVKDMDDDGLTHIIDSPANGVLSNCNVISDNYTCTYTPNLNFDSDDTITYKVNDGTVDSNTATVTISVTPVNDKPVIGANQSFTTNEDTAVSFTLSPGTDVDVPAQTLQYKIIAQPTKGTLSGCINNTTYETSRNCVYTPSLNYNGTDSFTYLVNDGISDSVSIATVSFTISAVNDAPVLANTQAVSTLEDQPLTFNLNAGTDIENDALTYIKVTDTTNGSITCLGGSDRSCTYTPNADFEGTDSFTYKANDSALDSNMATVTITVTALNDRPVIGADQSFTTDEDTAYSFTLNSGTDIDLPAQTLSYKLISAPSKGSLSGCINTSSYETSRNCTYTPYLNQNGSDSFTYLVNDSLLDSVSVATVSITITPVNDAPEVGANQILSTRDDYSYSFTLSEGSDVDTALASLQYKLVSPPSIGTLSDCISTATYTTDRTCNYIAPLNYNGSVSFTYLVYDGFLDSASVATITINVADQSPTTPNLSPQNFSPTISTSNSPMTLTASSCSDISFIMIQESSTAPLATSTGWQSCTTALGALSFDPTITNQQGFRTLRIYGKDAYNNISTPQLINFIFDTLPPQISISSIPTLPNNISYPVKWSLTEASISASSSFRLEYSLDNGVTWTHEAYVPVAQDGPHASTPYSYNWPVPSGTYPASLFRISLTDNNGQSATSVSNGFRIVVDLNAPYLIAGSMKINGSATPPVTAHKYVNVTLDALDADTNVTHFCLKLSSAVPSSSDGCWRAVDATPPGLAPSPSLNLVNYPFLLGFLPGTFNVYAWVRDLAGNISTNTATTGHDVVTITYVSDTAPVISNFFVSNTPTPPNPITSNEMTFYQGDPVYIKWTAEDDKGLLDTIELTYTTDDINFFPIAANLSNGSNNCGTVDEGGTTLDDNSTGCFLWSSPVLETQYFRIQIVVEDNANQASSTLSSPLNSSTFRVLAGNVDPGINSSAKSAIFSPPGTPSLYTLAVANDGKVFIRDAVYGLLYINPQTGVLEQLLKVTGTSTGDNGPVRSATANSIYKITMDHEDRLIIWDYDRIRRVDTKLEPMQIETIIGAYNNGAAGTQTTDTVTNPMDLMVYPGPDNFSLLQPLPNGDILFQSGPYGSVNDGNILRIYKGSLPTPRINSIRVSGIGARDEFNGALDLSTDRIAGYFPLFNKDTSALTKLMVKLQRYPVGCSFYTLANVDLTTYASTTPHPPAHVSTCGDYADRIGLDGSLYRLNNNVAWPIQVSKYNPATNTSTPVLGSVGQGYCPDGTLATSCKTNMVDVFVTSTGKMFFMDNGLVRVLDDSNRVRTLYGQTKTYGDGGLAQDARFNSIQYLDHGVGDNVIVYDQAEKVLREIRPNALTNQMIRLAGNGETGTIDFAAPAATQLMNGASWNQPGTFSSSPITGNVYFTCIRSAMCRLNRSTGLWDIYSNNGSTHWTTLGSIDGTTLRSGGYALTISGFYNGRMVTGHYDWSGAMAMNSTLREFNEGTMMSTFLAGKVEEDGATGCPDGSGNNCNLATARSEGRALTYHTGINAWLFEHHDNQIKRINVSGSTGSIQLFTTMAEPILSMVWNSNNLYYCTEEGLLKQMAFPGLAITTLNFPSTSIKCSGYRMLYKAASGNKPHRLVFPFRQNGLAGVGEFFLP